MKLSLYETRVLGALIEKAATTPDQYPMSLNALTNACNQKTNRDPVLTMTEVEVQNTLDSLAAQHLVSEQRFGNRVPKYQHRFCNTEFGDLKLSKQELAIICVLFLRGPQTPGELRTRTNRQCDFSSVEETEAVLEKLIHHEKGPYVVKLERLPGKRESRYAHLFSGDVEEAAASQSFEEARPATTSASSAMEATPAEAASTEHTQGLTERVELLEMTVEDLQSELSDLKTLVEQLTQ